jgi:hypothetical protein
MPEQYKPGDKVPKSGIYKVVHDTVYDEEHEVTARSSVNPSRLATIAETIPASH